MSLYPTWLHSFPHSCAIPSSSLLSTVDLNYLYPSTFSISFPCKTTFLLPAPLSLTHLLSVFLPFILNSLLSRAYLHLWKFSTTSFLLLVHNIYNNVFYIITWTWRLLSDPICVLSITIAMRLVSDCILCSSLDVSAPFPVRDPITQGPSG